MNDGAVRLSMQGDCVSNRILVIKIPLNTTASYMRSPHSRRAQMMGLMIQGLDFRGRPRPNGAASSALMHAQVLHAVHVTVFTTHLHCVSASMPKGL